MNASNAFLLYLLQNKLIFVFCCFIKKSLTGTESETGYLRVSLPTTYLFTMLIILSPAKIQNFKSQDLIQKYTLPQFTEKANKLIEELLPLSIVELERILQVNNQIATRAADSYYNWNNDPENKNAKQAILTYNGEVFHGLDANTLSAGDLEYAQQHLRILSGLYGVLRPLDLIQPYRLEMNTRLEKAPVKNLYSYWEKEIPSTIEDALAQSGKPDVLLNLASNEYAKSVQFKKNRIPVIDFEFLENKDGVYKTITIYTKKARGLMARYVIENRIETVEDLKGFDYEGYWFNNSLSTGGKFVFTRG